MAGGKGKKGKEHVQESLMMKPLFATLRFLASVWSNLSLDRTFSTLLLPFFPPLQTICLRKRGGKEEEERAAQTLYEITRRLHGSCLYEIASNKRLALWRSN